MYSCFLSASAFFPISHFPKLFQCTNLWDGNIGYGFQTKNKISFYIQENVTFRAYSYISSALCLIAVFTMGLFSKGSICLIAPGILSKKLSIKTGTPRTWLLCFLHFVPTFSFVCLRARALSPPLSHRSLFKFWICYSNQETMPTEANVVNILYLWAALLLFRWSMVGMEKNSAVNFVYSIFVFVLMSNVCICAQIFFFHDDFKLGLQITIVYRIGF